MSSNVRPESMERITTLELAQKFIDEQVAEVRAQVGEKKVLLALSGGVDSSVVAALLIKAIGKQLVCVHVNHGLMRKGESEDVIKVFGEAMDANLIYIDATDRYLDLLAGVASPSVSARSSVKNSSRSSARKLTSWKALSSWHRVLSIPTSLSPRALRPITTLAVCLHG